MDLSGFPGDVIGMWNPSGSPLSLVAFDRRSTCQNRGASKHGRRVSCPRPQLGSWRCRDARRLPGRMRRVAAERRCSRWWICTGSDHRDVEKMPGGGGEDEGAGLTSGGSRTATAGGSGWILPPCLQSSVTVSRLRFALAHVS